MSNVYAGAISLAESTTEQMSRQFRDAYTDILKASGRQIVTVQDTSSYLFRTLIGNDPIYSYLRMTASRRGHLPDKALAQFEFLMGFKMKEYLKRQPPKKYAQFMAAALADIGGVELPVGIEPEFAFAQPETLLYRDMYKGERKKITQGGAAETFADRAFRQFTLYVTRRANAEQVAVYEKGQRALLKEEHAIISKWIVRKMQTLGSAGIDAKFLVRYTQPAPLTSVYDEDGFRHLWTTYVYKNKKELTSGFAGHAPFVAVKCSSCGAIAGKTHLLDLEKTEEAVRIRTDMGRLLSLFSTRCPEGGTHEFDATKCTKCGMLKTLLTPTDAVLARPEAMKFFRKYAKQGQVPKLSIQLKNPTVPQLPSMPTGAIESNRSLLSDLVGNIPKISANSVLNLGDADGRPEAEMSQAPREIDSPDRALRARGMFYQAVVMYCNFVYFENGAKPPPWLEKIPSIAELAKHTNGLDQIHNTFEEDFTSYFVNGAFYKASQVAIWSIVRMFSDITNFASKAWTSNVPQTLAGTALALVNAIMSELVRSDQLFCEAGAFDFKILQEIDVADVVYDDPADVGEDIEFHEKMAAVSAQHSDIHVDEEFVLNPFANTHDVEDGADDTNYNLN
jgi:hypothetical protein